MAVEEQVYYHSRADFVKMANEQSTVEEEIAKRSKVGHTHPATDVIQDADHRFSSDSEKAALAAQGVYTNNNKVPVDHGGVTFGSTFNKIPIQDVLTGILYPYTQPTKKVVVIPDGGVYEKGSAVDISKVTIEVTPRSNAINKLALAIGSTSLTSENISATTEVITKAYAYQSGEARVTSDASVVLTVSESDGKTSVASSTPFTFVRPIYYGAIANAGAISETVVKGCTKSIEAKSSKMSKTFNCDYQRTLFAYPTEYGDLTAIYDPNGFNLLSTYTKSTVILTCLDGSNVSYNVYVNEAATVSNFNITFCL